MKHVKDIMAGTGAALANLASITPAQMKLIDASSEVLLSPGTAENACYLHAILCQVGMPRKRTPELTFERRSGSASLLLTAGKVWNGRAWVQQALPYGPKPRLILINLTSAAVMTGSRTVDVGRSTREFMERVGLDPQGSEYKSLRRQVAALSVCRMQLGATVGGMAITLDTQPIHRFDAWIVPNADQQTLWPGTVELSQEYFDNVKAAAVPLDERAIAALRGTALGLDVYTWLAHRLHRIREANGVPIRWEAIKAQFGQEYRTMTAFRQEFRETLKQVSRLYPSARIEETSHGLRLRQSAPPIQPRVAMPVSKKPPTAGFAR
jgi:Plasmid encoded RepA protein